MNLLIKSLIASLSLVFILQASADHNPTHQQPDQTHSASHESASDRGLASKDMKSCKKCKSKMDKGHKCTCKMRGKKASKMKCKNKCKMKCKMKCKSEQKGEKRKCKKMCKKMCKKNKMHNKHKQKSKHKQRALDKNEENQLWEI